jgi:DNA-binding CsgD family transcriptional regulator
MTAPILVMTGYASGANVNRAYDLGARVVVKPDFERVLRWVKQIAKRDTALAAALDSWARRYGLTVAELANFELAARNKTQQEIADERGVSLATVENQVRSLREKTGDRTLERAVIRLLLEKRRLE